MLNGLYKIRCWKQAIVFGQFDDSVGNMIE
jgi:hypothetical protein